MAQSAERWDQLTAEHHSAVIIGKLLTPMCLSPRNIIWCWAKGGTVGLTTARFVINITRRLTA